MNYEAYDFWWKILLTVINLGLGAYLFWERHDESIKKRLDKMDSEVDARLDNHASRVAKIEARMEVLPSHDNLGDLHDRINDVSSGMNTMTGELTGIKSTLSLIHNHLLNRGNK
jgi:Protein of unknown function (DUF2730)